MVYELSYEARVKVVRVIEAQSREDAEKMAYEEVIVGKPGPYGNEASIYNIDIIPESIFASEI